jgi:hypothetical protein
LSQWLTGSVPVSSHRIAPLNFVHFICGQDEYPWKPWKLASINARGELQITLPDWLEKYPKIALIVGTTGAGKSKIGSFLGKKLLQSSSGRQHCTEGMYAQPVILHKLLLRLSPNWDSEIAFCLSVCVRLCVCTLPNADMWLSHYQLFSNAKQGAGDGT